MYIFVIKPDTILIPLTMVKSHGKKCKNNFRVTTSQFIEMYRREASIQSRKKLWILTTMRNI